MSNSETGQRQSGAYTDQRLRNAGENTAKTRCTFRLRKQRTRTWVVIWNPSVEEVEKAIRAFSDEAGEGGGTRRHPGRTAQLGTHRAEQFGRDEQVNRAMHKVIEQVWRTGLDWTQSTFVPIYKKGDPTVCANYRTISDISR